MIAAARENPISGESTIGMTTFSTTPSQCTTVAEASAEPTRPPMSAWLEEEGRPKYQVIRFHVIAPISPAATTTRPCEPSGASMMPLPTVCATWVPRWAPMKFMAAAMNNAALGVRARVETEVAMAFAASWKPLV